MYLVKPLLQYNHIYENSVLQLFFKLKTDMNLE